MTLTHLSPRQADVIREVLTKAGTGVFQTGQLWPRCLATRSDQPTGRGHKPSLVARMEGKGLFEWVPAGDDSGPWGYRITKLGLEYAREYGLVPEGTE